MRRRAPSLERCSGKVFLGLLASDASRDWIRGEEERTMKRSRRRWRQAAQVVGVAVGLTGTGASAVGFFNPGLLASWTFGKQGGFGLGAEVSFMEWPSGSSDTPAYIPLPVNYGAFLQVEKLWGEGRTFRAAAGAQAAPAYLPYTGGELGMFLQHDSRGWGSGVHGGLWGSAGVIGLALRGTFGGAGGFVESALVLTVKAPLPYGCPPDSCVL